MDDSENNRLSARANRYLQVGTRLSGVAARMVGSKLFSSDDSGASNAQALTKALGGLKGPLMKVAQLIATIPDAVPPEYATELQKLQSHAPPMGAGFVKRRMMAELGANWRSRFQEFDLHPSAAASLGQVHKATTHDAEHIACKLQYPDMESAVEADLNQLQLLLNIHKRIDRAIDTRHIATEIGERIREELDYTREARHAKLYQRMLHNTPCVRVPVVYDDLSTKRLLTLGWLSGNSILNYKTHDLDTRNRIAQAMFQAWWHPFAHYGVIHGDPHLGNYTVFENEGRTEGINLLDYGCVRIFPPQFVGGVVALYEGLRDNRPEQVVSAYEIWGFENLSKNIIDTLNIWARFIYGPMLDDRVRTLADGVSPGEYGRAQAFEVHQALKRYGPVTVPREFVFMDRAAIGLGGAFLHLDAKLNFHKLFETQIQDFDINKVQSLQNTALKDVNLNSAICTT